jgi:hypothetical protein
MLVLRAAEGKDEAVSIGTILFNPFTGKPRHPADIASDPKGMLVWDGEQPLRACTPRNEAQAEEALELLKLILAGSIADIRRKAPEHERGRWFSITVRGDLLERARTVAGVAKL